MSPGAEHGRQARESYPTATCKVNGTQGERAGAFVIPGPGEAITLPEITAFGERSRKSLIEPASSFRSAPSEAGMDFGISFSPNVGPHEKSAARYWDEALRLVDLCDEVGYTHVRTVEHYFHPYGGYTPNPIVFLAAASQRTRHARLVTGAVLPAFNHPLKVAGEAGMLDAISGGRLDLGLARAFLPHEFARFGVSLDESRARYEEGVEQIRRLLSEEGLSMTGAFHSFTNVTSLPRPTQKPHPPIWVAALNTPETFDYAGRNGFHCMANPIGGSKLNELLGIYREAWKSAGHPGHDTRCATRPGASARSLSEGAEAEAEGRGPRHVI
jgi:alkanesulfonate monooxygenase SsuD/methylene tetrahydromethanopterin reductase-like flavin-dependent oxidoreductase (luciferase family)